MIETLLLNIGSAALALWVVTRGLVNQRAQFAHEPGWTTLVLLNHMLAASAAGPLCLLSWALGWPHAFRFLWMLLVGLAGYTSVFVWEQRQWSNMVKGIPGPRTRAQGVHPLFGLIPVLRKHRNTFSTEWGMELFKQYGPVVANRMVPWLKTMDIRVTDPADVRFILKDEFDSFVKPPFFGNLFGELLGHGIFNVNHAYVPDGGASWRLQRKISSKLFTSRQLQSLFHSTFLQKGRQVLRLLQRHAENERTVDWQAVCFAFTLDSIGRIGFGMDLGCLAAEAWNGDQNKAKNSVQGQPEGGQAGKTQAHDKTDCQAASFAAAFDTAQRLCFSRIQRPGFESIFGMMTRPERELRECVTVMRQFTTRVIADRRRDPDLPARADILSMFIKEGDRAAQTAKNKNSSPDSSSSSPELKQKLGKASRGISGIGDLIADGGFEHGFSDDFLRDVVMSFVIAGRDTTAATLTFVVWLLTRPQHADVMANLLEEISRVQGPSSSSSSSSSSASSSSATAPSSCSEPDFDSLSRSSMPFLDGVVKECLRLFPPVPIDPKYCAAPEGRTLPSGHFIPCGAVVMYAPYVMGRDPARYPDPLRMDPGRWIGKPEPSPFEFPVFQAGRRVCLGMNMAYLEIKVLVVQVLRQYRLECVRPSEVVFNEGLTLSVEGGLHVRVSPRQKAL